MINLPVWNLTLCPPLYDTSSLSPIEQTAQVYSKMRELVEEYNKFATDVNTALSDYIANINGDVDEFKKLITCLMQEYIQSVDSKVGDLQSLLNEHKEAIVSEVMEKIDVNINEAIIKYNEESEEIIIGGGV